MGNFFKKVGTGFVVILLLPFMVVFFALFAVYSLIKFIALWFIALSKFFIGERISDPLDIDRKAAELFEEKQNKKKGDETKNTEQGKFAGATINIYTNQPVNESIGGAISHFSQVTPITTQDVFEVTTSEPIQIEEQQNNEN